MVFANLLLRARVSYSDLGADHFDRLAKERLTRHYIHRLEQLGHHVTVDAPAVAS